MRRYSSYVLLLGVGLEILHCDPSSRRDDCARPLSAARRQSELYECRDRHGFIRQVRTRRHWRLDRDFPKFGPPLERQGIDDLRKYRRFPVRRGAAG